jgi:hypothetical protein
MTFHALAPAAVVLSMAMYTVQAQQAPSAESVLGRWYSVEQFEGEPRFSFGFTREGGDIVGWAVLLGQTRKQDNRATLAMAFYGAKWETGRLTFKTILPEDGGTLAWTLVPTDAKRAKVTAITEDGEELSWELVRRG